MAMKLWLDDDPIRDGWVDDTWTIVRSPWAFLNILAHSEPGEVEALSFDHDLGCFTKSGEERTGYWVLSKMELLAFKYPAFLDKIPSEIAIHSANSVGRKNMQAAIDSIERMRNERDGT